MDITEIKQELKRRGWTNAMLAEKIGKNPNYVSNVLSGSTKLTESTAKHIALLFESTRTVFFAYAVDVPEATCRSWVPGFENLTPRQQVEAVKAVVVETLKKLAKNGYEALTEEDRRAMADVLPRPYDDDGALEAADDGKAGE